MRRFNTTGSCKPNQHYMLPAEARLPGARALLEEDLYFVVHAPRQTGKTTTLNALAQSLSGAGDRVALRVSCETAQVAGDDYGAAENIVLEMIRDSANFRGLPPQWLPPDPWPQAPAGTRVKLGLRAWAQRCPVPIVLLFDEIDALYGPSMMTMLRQLRDGFEFRPEGFPASVVVSGLRDVRDYKTAAGGDGSRLGGTSPFNIAVESLRLGDFTADDIATLYAQHTNDTGQVFTDAAVERAFRHSAGQPWLVNALAREVVVKMRVTPPTLITERHIDQAAQRIIATRATHLDSLADKLNEPSVRRVMQRLFGETDNQLTDPTYDNDVSYARDLGLIARQPPLAIANPIYWEVITRVLAQPVIDMVPDYKRSFLLPDGRVDIDRLLREFVGFWREHGDLMKTGRGFDEFGAKIVLLAFFYRIINGGGSVVSEYGAGLRNIDVLVSKPYTNSDGAPCMQKEALELKVWRHGDSDPIDEGLDQLDTYLAKLGLDQGTLAIFDRRLNAPPLTERGVFTDETTADGRKVRLLRL